jgi:excisionase family DNA binding protein
VLGTRIHASQKETHMALLTVDQAADRLGTKTRFIRRLIAEKRITYIKIGGHVRIEDEVLDDFVEAGRVRVQPPVDGHRSSTAHFNVRPSNSSA